MAVKRSTYFYRINLAVVRASDRAEVAEKRAKIVVRAMENAERQLERRPVALVVDGALRINVEVLEAAGLEIRRVARPAADKLTVDLVRAQLNGRGSAAQAKLL
jgi:hypothetical protein